MTGQVRVLIDGDTVRRRVAALAAEVAADHADVPPVLVGILNGAVPFMMELLRALPESWSDHVDYDFLDATSYRGTLSSGHARVRRDLVVDVQGRAVLVVDGIVDTGHTLDAVLEYLKGHHPERVRVCALLDKPSRRQVEVHVDYRGFEVDDVFVVGYGMDLDQRYRGLRFIGVL